MARLLHKRSLKMHKNAQRMHKKNARFFIPSRGWCSSDFLQSRVIFIISPPTLAFPPEREISTLQYRKTGESVIKSLSAKWMNFYHL